MALPMALPMTLPTALPMSLAMTLLMSLPANLQLASSLVNDTSDKVCSTLASSLVTDKANIDLPLPLLLYPNISLPFHFHCITCIDLRTAHSYIINILLGSKLFFQFFNLWFLPITQNMFPCPAIATLIIIVRSQYFFLLFNQWLYLGIFLLISYYLTILMIM